MFFPQIYSTGIHSNVSVSYVLLLHISNLFGLWAKNMCGMSSQNNYECQVDHAFYVVPYV